MTTAVDFDALEGQSAPRVTLVGNTKIGETGTGGVFSGFSAASSLYLSAKVQLTARPQGSPGLTLLIEHSDDGISWSTAETFSFGDDGEQDATLSSPKDYLRASWTMSGSSEWYLHSVTAAPLASLTSGGGSQPSTAIKEPCVVIADDAITLAGLQTIDFYTVQEGDRVLALQPGGSDGGIWIASAGAWTRATDADAVGDIVSGTLVPISQNGAAYAGAIALLNPSATPWTPDVDSIAMDIVAGMSLLYADSSMHDQAAGSLAASLGKTGAAIQTGALVLMTSDPMIAGALWNDAGTVALSAGSAPSNVSAPVATGTPQDGQSVSVSEGIWAGTPAPTFTYIWEVSDDGLAGWTPLGGETSGTLVLAIGQVGKYVRSTVTATNVVGSASTPSNVLGPVAA